LSWAAETRRAIVASLRSGAVYSGWTPLASSVAACDPGQLANLAIFEGLAGSAGKGSAAWSRSGLALGWLAKRDAMASVTLPTSACSGGSPSR
jgi:hypothetical protein